MLNTRQGNNNNNRRRRNNNNRNNNNQGNGSRIDNRARGNAPQLLEKYRNMARDAQLAGDRVMTEYYLQFADHYFRVVSEMRARYEDQQPQPRRNRDEWDSADFDADGESEKSAARPHAFTSGHEDDDSDEPEIDVRRAERPAQGARQHAAPQDEDETNAKPRPSRRSAFERIRNEAAAIPVEESPTAQTVQHGLPLDALPPAIGLAAAGAELADEAQVEVVAAPKKRGRARKVATTAEAA